jgi:putative ABC transport system substrate-binding protein
MKRREFITLFGGAVAAWPLAARAQRPSMPVIGLLSSRVAGNSAYLVAAFREGLKELGYIEGQNVAIEYRWAEGRFDRLPDLTRDLVSRRVAVIAAAATGSVIAAKAATSTIPIVFEIAGDPIKFGFVASLNRPGSNLTGVTFLGTMMTTKQLEVLHETVPNAPLIAFLVNPANPRSDSEIKVVQAATEALGIRLLVLKASVESDFAATFAMLAQQRAGALLVDIDPYFNSRADQLIAFAARHAIPTIYPLREYVAAGGLMSYGTSLSDAWHQMGAYAGRILKGDKPADLPVQQSTKVELVINIKTGKAIGLTIPPSVLARADELID